MDRGSRADLEDGLTQRAIQRMLFGCACSICATEDAAERVEAGGVVAEEADASSGRGEGRQGLPRSLC